MIPLAIGTFIAAGACNDARPPAAGTTAAVAGASGGGQRDRRPRAVVVSPTRGASSVDPQVRIHVVVSCLMGPPCSTDPAATLATIGSKIRILDPGGVNAVAVVLDAASAPGTGAKAPAVPASEYPAAFVPAAALREDQQYFIEVHSDSEAVVGAFDASEAEQQAGLEATSAAPAAHGIPIFTGSAPAITRIDVANDPRKPLTSVRVRFSEPVNFAALAASGISFRSLSGASLGGCVWSATQQKCADAASTEVSEVFDFVFPAAVAAGDITSGRVQLAGAVRGIGRTIAQTAAMRGLTMTTVARSPTLSMDLAPATWSSCSPGHDVLCARPVASAVR